MTLTGHRIFQYVGILLAFGLLAGGYWYFSVRAGVKTNSATSNAQGTGRLDSGLFAYWKLDENTGTTTTDASTNGVVGTLTSGPTWTAGQIGQGVEFDGVNDQIISTSVSNFITVQTQPHSGFAWVYPNTPDTTSQAIWSIGENDDADYTTGMYMTGNGGYLCWAVNGADSDPACSTLALSANQWQFVGFSRTATTVTFFLNGNTQTISSASAFTIGPDPIIIGDTRLNLVDQAAYWDGTIDEVRIYDRALSIDEMNQIYRLRTPTGVDTSLKGYWSMDGQDIAGTSAYDRSGAGNTGTIANASPVITARGKLGQALGFDGTNDYINLGSAASLDNIVNLTTCIWANPTGTSDGSLITKDDSATGWAVHHNASTNRSISFYRGWDGGSGFGRWDTANETLPNNVWTHVCVTYNDSSTANDPIIYLNGVPVPTTEVNTPTGTLVDESTFTAVIASYGAGLGEFFGGNLDEARIYNRLLSAAEVKSLYEATAPDKTNTNDTQAQGGTSLAAGLALYWPLDDATGTNADDKSSNNDDGTLTNGPTWTTGQIGGGVDFDGANDYISVADPANGVLDFSPPASAGPLPGDVFSLSAWFNRDTFTTDDTIFAKKNSQTTNTDDGYIVWIDDADDKIYVRVDDAVDNDTSYSNSSTSYTATGWHQLTVVFDEEHLYPSGGLCPVIFVDGVNVTDGASCTNYLHYSADLSNALAFTVGAESDGGNPFDGKLDDIRVYNRPIGLTEIDQLYRGTITTTGIETGLRGYWSFGASDVVSSFGLAAYDRSGAGNWGTIVNATKKGGKIGQGLSFDGSGDYVLVPSSPTLDDQHTFTYAAWIYPTGSAGCANGYGPVIEKGTGSSERKYLRFDCGGGGSDRTLVGFVDTATTNAFSSTAPGAITYNQWQYVAMTYDNTGDRKIRLYINGIETPYSTQTAGTGTVVSDSTHDINLGATPSTQFYVLPGKLDEVRIYNRVLDVAELRSLYDAGSDDKTNSSASTPQGTGNPDSGLAAYWRLDDNTGTSATDSSTNGNAGTLTNGPTWAVGRIGSGVDLDGTNDYINVASASATDNLAAMTVCAWINPDASQPVTYPIIVKKGGDGVNKWDFYFYGGGVGTSLNEGAAYINMSANNQIPSGQWGHACAVQIGGNSANFSLYLNGVPAERYVESGSTTRPSDTGAPIRIGAAASGDSHFAGLIDEVRIYNRGLSASEITDVYRLTTPTGVDTGLKGYWSFNGQDMSGTAAYDRSGAGNTGTLTNGPAAARGKLGQALNFDGTGKWVGMGDINALDVATALTASAWVKTSSLATEKHIVDKSDCAGYTDGGTFELFGGYTAANKPEFSVYRSLGSPVGYNASSSVAINDGQWHLVTGTYDGSYVRIYVDGVETGQTAAASIVLSPTSKAVEVGGRCNGVNPFYWNGGIDEVRLYNRALSASEVQALYNSGK